MKNMSNSSPLYRMVQGAVIAALYIVLFLAFQHGFADPGHQRHPRQI